MPLEMNLQFFGGRGADSGLSFSIPNGSGNFDDNSLGEKIPETSKEAIGTKGKSKSVADALKNVNPNYSADYSEFSENCQRCVVAYELRRRGYNVEAQPTYKGDTWNQGMRINGVDADRWRGAFRHAKTVSVGGTNTNKVLENITKEMQGYGSGSRAVIGITYKGGRSGHVFNVENSGGHISYVDAQNGQRYNTASMRNLLGITITKNVGLTRTDNLRISERSKEFVWQKNRNK